MKALITGIAGFAGSHLAEHLLAAGDEVIGVTHEVPSGLPAGLEGRVKLNLADAGDQLMMAELLEEERPEAVYHLAARARVGEAWANLEATYRDNILGQLGLLEAIRTTCVRSRPPRVLVIGSYEEYGEVAAAQPPVREEAPLRPLSPYGVSKVTQDLMGLQYFLSFGIPVVRVRPAGHIGPRQADGFAVPDFARKIAEVEAGLARSPILVGNLKTQRDLTDVRDVVRAYRLLIERGVPGEVYNVGSGRVESMRFVLDFLLGESTADMSYEEDKSEFRPSDVSITHPDTTRLRAATGWAPAIPLEDSLRAVLKEWRGRVTRRPGDQETK
jgi:GDP-4-dehydro-6-deoxy-D-mannose reductase